MQSINGNHVIDFEADPFVPEGWIVDFHEKTYSGTTGVTRVGDDLFLFLPHGRKIEFFLTQDQVEGELVRSDKIFRGINELKEYNMLVLDANVLDYLLAHPELIPESWKFDDKGRTRWIHFWATIYVDSVGTQCVRHLKWENDQWGWGSSWLVNVRGISDPAAMLAS